MGAIISILILLFDPFLQQVVVYPSCLVPSEKPAVIVRSERYGARSYEGLPLPSVVDLSMKAAIYNGVFAIGNDAESNIQYSCSTGNCTWPEFSSLAVCSKCENITSLVEKSCNDSGCYMLSLPNGPTLSGLGGQINASTTNISSSLNQIQASVFKFSSLISKRIKDPDDALAMECAMWYCVQTYQASVEDAMINQHILRSWRNDSATLGQSSDLIYNVSASSPNAGLNPTIFEVSHLAAAALNSFMSETFTGSGGINNTGPAFSSDVIQALYNTDNLTARIENLAISMTNNIRQQNDSVASPWHGTAWKGETYVHVRWAWLSFPVTVAVLALLFLFGSIIETAHRDILVWKSSNLALLFHGQDLELTEPPMIHVNKASRMAQMAKDVKLHLTQTLDKDWKLVQR
ncbi:hypothetical protein G7Y79_00065g094500 [Physcia stellaris]|nr:hypothetical protein G7Y79_00065g094500 [Physcia stellaris]